MRRVCTHTRRWDTGSVNYYGEIVALIYSKIQFLFLRSTSDIRIYSRSIYIITDILRMSTWVFINSVFFSPQTADYSTLQVDRIPREGPIFLNTDIQ